MHGGGAVALLTFLGSLVSEEALRPLGPWLLVGILGFHLGLVVTVVHNHLRRRCSFAWEIGSKTKDDGVCWWSWFCLYVSVVLFFVAGLIALVGSLVVFVRI